MKCYLYYTESIVYRMISTSQLSIYIISSLSIYPTISGHLGCSHILAAANNAANNIRMHVSCHFLQQPNVLNCHLASNEGRASEGQSQCRKTCIDFCQRSTTFGFFIYVHQSSFFVLKPACTEFLSPAQIGSLRRVV